MGSFRAWVNGHRRSFRNKKEEGVIVAAMSDYRPFEFQQNDGPDLFRAFIDAFTRGDEKAVREICTPAFGNRAATGIAADRAALGGVRGAKVVAALAAPESGGHRTWHPDPMASLTAEPHVAQVTVRMTWQMQPAFQPLTPRATVAGRLAAGGAWSGLAIESGSGGSDGEASGHAPAEADAAPAPAGASAGAGGGGKSRKARKGIRIVATSRKGAVAASSPGVVARASVPHTTTCTGTWLPAVDPASGHVFYFNDLTGSVSWTTPPMLGVVEPARALVLDEIGVEVEPFEGVAAPGEAGAAASAAAAQEGASGTGDDAGSEAPSLKVVTHVTFERIFPKHAVSQQDGSWRIANIL
uniref:WW domain-containing protein n=1 Tax=Cafeteria roenbergensis TaxID=33653 RepID=A0A7S0K6A6_CAFRO